ncbi:CGNR zinc finger domain-containing protein [Streptomyces sp. NPDC002596]
MNGPEPLTGEPLALDLVNTLPHTVVGPPVDHLADAAGLRVWLALQAGRLPEPGRITEADLVAIHQVRTYAVEAIGRARQGERPPQDALRGLNEAQLAAPAVRYAEWRDDRMAVESRRSGAFGAQVAAALAESVVDLLADPAFGSVRECEAADCTMLFLPAHPRRRWCSASRCGNRARVARYYQRHKTT